MMKVIVRENDIQGGAAAFEIFEKVSRMVPRS